jgi:hypothetical protein
MDELAFCKEEITYFEHRLEGMIADITARDLLADIEHFQNQFIREREVIDELIHEIKIRQQEVAHMAQSEKELDHDYQMKRHVKLGDRVIRFNELYGDLKISFNRFSVKWLERKLN